MKCPVVLRPDRVPPGGPDGDGAGAARSVGRNPWRICRHCGKSNVGRPRGLCWRCYYAPGVKDLYPSASRYAARGVGHGMRCTAPPPEPTAVPPGPDKVAILAERAARGEQLFHEGDAIV